VRGPTRALLALLWLSGCERSQPERMAVTQRASSPVAESPPRRAGSPEGAVHDSTAEQALGTLQVTPLGPALRRPAARQLIAIGDLHGDLDATRRALRLAGAIDASDHWVGGELVVVQTGDFLDRGDDEVAIMDLIDRLRVEAPKAGGALIALSGNHELMNVAQDFRYVTPGGFSAFSGAGGRDQAFRPGGAFARRLAERPVVSQVGDTVFVHGGVLPKHVRYGLTRISEEVQGWMRGELPEPPAIVMASDGLIWTRLYSSETGAEGCALLAQALELLGARRMVVGHTPQPAGITSACDERVWRIDTGMSRHYGGPVEVLEIAGELVKPRKEPAHEAANAEH
jgi:hypothetical protein